MFWLQRGRQQMLFPPVSVVMTAGLLLIHFFPEVASAQTVPVEAQSGTIEKSLPQSPPTFAPPPETKAPEITNDGSKPERPSLKASEASPKFFIKKIKLTGNRDKKDSWGDIVTLATISTENGDIYIDADGWVIREDVLVDGIEDITVGTTDDLSTPLVNEGNTITIIDRKNLALQSWLARMAAVRDNAEGIPSSDSLDVGEGSASEASALTEESSGEGPEEESTGESSGEGG